MKTIATGVAVRERLPLGRRKPKPTAFVSIFFLVMTPIGVAEE